MRESYGCVQVKTQERERVLHIATEVARARGIRCLVGPASAGWVGVYSEGYGQDEEFGLGVADKVGGVVMQLMVHDDDVLEYWVWENGKLVDTYCSQPGYFYGEDTGELEQQLSGDSEVLARTCGGTADALREALNQESDEEVSGVNRLAKLVKILGIRNAVTAYEYLKGQDVDGTIIRQGVQYAEIDGTETAAPTTVGATVFEEDDSQFGTDGKRLAVIHGAELPERCAVCNRDGAQLRPERLLYGNEGDVGLHGLVGLIIGLVLARKLDAIFGYCRIGTIVEIKAHLCTRHRWAKHMWVLCSIGAGVLSAGVFLFLIYGMHDEEVGIVVPMIVVIWCCLLVSYFVRRNLLLRPKKFDGKWLWIDGCGPEFLASLPRIEQNGPVDDISVVLQAQRRD